MKSTNHLLLVGPAGSGKSVLAREIAIRQETEFWAGHCFNYPLSLHDTLNGFKKELIVIDDIPESRLPLLLKEMSDLYGREDGSYWNLPRLIVCMQPPQDENAVRVLARLSVFFFRIDLSRYCWKDRHFIHVSPLLAPVENL